jgi:hypothetical protein
MCWCRGASFDHLAAATVLVEWVEREEAGGGRRGAVSADFPKMPGEPPRVQPSLAWAISLTRRDVAAELALWP